MKEADLAKLLTQITQDAANNFIANNAQVESDGTITVSHGSKLVKAIALTPENGQWLVFQSGSQWYAIATIQNRELSSETVFQRRKRRRRKDQPFKWAYLWEVNEFTDLSTPFTDSRWSWDDLSGVWRPFGDGGGEFKTQAELIDSFASLLQFPQAPPYYKVLQSKFGFNLTSAVNSTEPVYVGIPPVTRYSGHSITAKGDGVQYGIGFGTRPGNETYGSVAIKYRRIIPERNYWVKQSEFNQNWSYQWGNKIDLDPNLNYPQVRYKYLLAVSGDESGEKGKFFNISERSYRSSNPNDFGSRQVYRYSVEGENFYTFNRQAEKEFARRKRGEAIAALNGAGYSSPSFSVPGSNFDLGIFSGQQIIDGAAGSLFTARGSIPSSIDVGEDTWPREPASGLKNAARVMSVSTLYLIPEEAERNPGKKEIYCQIRGSKRVLLHTIPLTETWDGAISPLDKNNVEVVIRCGKKRDPSGQLNNANLDINRRSGTYVHSLYDREWSQTRVYRLNSLGKIISTNIYNNSGTVKNPSGEAQPIEIDERNWQKPWLENHTDYRTLDYYIQSHPRREHFWHLRERTGLITDLSSGYRSIYSDRNTQYIKTIDATDVTRIMIYYTSYGTLTSSGFVYLMPEDLYHPDVQLDYSLSFSTRFKPAPNYAVLQGLAEQKFTQEVYYSTTASYEDGSFVAGISTSKATKFPKLDLPDGLGDLQTGIKAIAYLG